VKAANKDWLRQQWLALLAHYGVAKAEALPVWDDLVDFYEGDGRYYHNLYHIQNVLGILERLRMYAQDLPAIQLAAWFHDAIYDVQRNDNEERSADYAADVLQALGLPATTIAKVATLIRATKHNRACPGDIDCQIMLDADLATFASDWETQVAIEQAIRQEFAYVPEAAYREGRRAILQNFLKRERIYYTEPMYREREITARENIQRSIDALSNESLGY
jgi:predicted metal-dependent HD superfamily phosphohydrolase